MTDELTAKAQRNHFHLMSPENKPEVYPHNYTCRANVELTCTVRDECTSFTFGGYAGVKMATVKQYSSFIELFF